MIVRVAVARDRPAEPSQHAYGMAHTHPKRHSSLSTSKQHPPQRQPSSPTEQKQIVKPPKGSSAEVRGVADFGRPAVQQVCVPEHIERHQRPHGRGHDAHDEHLCPGSRARRCGADAHDDPGQSEAVSRRRLLLLLWGSSTGAVQRL